LIDKREIIKVIAGAIQNARVDFPAIEPGIRRESVPFAEAILDALDRAGLTIVQKTPETLAKRHDN
jgi:hypothetical protein